MRLKFGLRGRKKGRGKVNWDTRGKNMKEIKRKEE